MEPQLQYPRVNARGLRPRRQKFAKAALCAAGKVTICERRSPRGPRSSATTRASACCTSARTAHRAS
eukprot:5907940-Prymnesium_polylepis.1